MILLTGAAGFIGLHTALALLARGEQVIGIDNLNSYYDPGLKKARLEQLQGKTGFTFIQADIADRVAMHEIMRRHDRIDRIVHLAAQAGVRHSLSHPHDYAHSNLDGQLVMLEAARQARNLKHFVYASSSSVYGGNEKQPFAVGDPVDQPLSLYAATKRASELMTQSYAHLYKFPATGLRFFTVYGPWGRPDMAYYSFARDIAEGRPIMVFNQGDMKRDFTWIGDCVEGILTALDAPPAAGGKYCIGGAAHRIFNIGNNRAEKLLDFIGILEQELGLNAEKTMAPMAPGDVRETCADIAPAREILGYNPKTPITEGLPVFIDWFRSYHNIRKVA